MKKARHGGRAQEVENELSERILLPAFGPSQDRRQVWLQFCLGRRTVEEQAEVERIKLLCQSFRESRADVGAMP